MDQSLGNGLEDIKGNTSWYQFPKIFMFLMIEILNGCKVVFVLNT